VWTIIFEYLEILVDFKGLIVLLSYRNSYRT
jgi:hypothetical protein